MRPRALLLLPLLACSGGDMGALPKGSDGDVLAALSLSAIVPAEGPTAGGTALTLGGAGFTDDLQVTVGGAACSTLTILSSVELACTTPPGLTGPVNVAALRPADGATASIAFTYLDESADGSGTDGGTTDGGGTGGDTGTSTGGGTGTGGDTGSSTGGGTGADAGTGGDTSDTALPTTPVDYCHIQWPCAMTAAASGPSELVYVWVYQASSTPGAGRGAGLTVQVGVGADGSSPDASGSWSTATYNVDKDGLVAGDLANDEYQGAFTVPAAAGSYDYAARVSADAGASWTTCDLGGASCGGGGSGDGYNAATAGQLTVP